MKTKVKTHLREGYIVWGHLRNYGSGSYRIVHLPSRTYVEKSGEVLKLETAEAASNVIKHKLRDSSAFIIKRLKK